jgi:hypothetical protein
MTNHHDWALRPSALLFGGALLTAVGASEALACRGTAEYPQVAQQLASASLPADQKMSLSRELAEGRALHERAHQQNDTRSMQESLRILDRVKAALPR